MLGVVNIVRFVDRDPNIDPRAPLWAKLLPLVFVALVVIGVAAR